MSPHRTSSFSPSSLSSSFQRQQEEDDDDVNDQYDDDVSDDDVSDDNDDELETDDADTTTTTTATGEDNKTIALFGGHGPTGRYFLKLALDAGYLVRALVPPPSSSGTTTNTTAADHQDDKNPFEIYSDQPQVTVIEGNFVFHDKDNDENNNNNDDENNNEIAVQEVIRGATYVVCLLERDTFVSNKKTKGNYEYIYTPNSMLNFVKKIYPWMKESCTQLFVYQASCLTIDAQGKSPVVAGMLKRLPLSFFINIDINSSNHHHHHHAAAFTKDHDNVVRYVVEQQNEYFDYIITRPGWLRDGPSRKKKLYASKSLPGPIPITHQDLAEFTLNALKSEKLYNTCPYVVGDGF